MKKAIAVNSLGELYECRKDGRMLGEGDLDLRQARFFRKVWALQTMFNDARFRILGGVRGNGREWIKLVTEFVYFMDAPDIGNRRLIRATLKRLHADIWIMFTNPHLDKYAPPQGKPGERVLKSTVKQPNGNRVHWAVGPDHDRMERQIEASWDITYLSAPNIKKRIAKLSKETKTIWKLNGMGVL